MTFANWIDTFLSEKGTNLDRIIEVEGDMGVNMIPVAVVVEAMKNAPANEQAQIKATLVKIDFLNGDHMHFIEHLAKALAL